MTKKQPQDKSNLPFYLSGSHFLLFSSGLIFLTTFLFLAYLMPQAGSQNQLTFYTGRQQVERETQAQTFNNRCPDLNSDNIVNNIDIKIISSKVGLRNYAYDFNLDGKINSSDVQFVMSRFNQKC